MIGNLLMLLIVVAGFSWVSAAAQSLLARRAVVRIRRDAPTEFPDAR